MTQLDLPSGSSVSPATRGQIFAWTLFDFANTAFYVVILTVGYPLYFKQVVAGHGLQSESLPSQNALLRQVFLRVATCLQYRRRKGLRMVVSTREPPRQEEAVVAISPGGAMVDRVLALQR